MNRLLVKSCSRKCRMLVWSVAKTHQIKTSRLLALLVKSNVANADTNVAAGISPIVKQQKEILIRDGYAMLVKPRESSSAIYIRSMRIYYGQLQHMF